MQTDGTCAIIEAIQIEKLSKPETTYNFEVADFHTYYVADSKVLVHNDCVLDALSKAKVDGGKWNKFNVVTEVEAKSILKDTLNSGKILQVGNNAGKIGSMGQKSFDILLDAGKVVGTKGERSILLIVDELGNILTVFPK